MDIKPIYLFAKWQVKTAGLEEVMSLLSEVVQKSTAEDGNLFYSIHQGNLDANILVLFEGYKNEAALAAHRDSAHFQKIVIGRIVPLLELREVIMTTPLEWII